jgi:tetratricopeptide (TPR) repeat protein
MDPEEPLFPDFDSSEFEVPTSQRESAKPVLPLKRDEPLWFLEEDDDKLRLMIGESKTRFEDTIITRGSYLFLKKDYKGSLACWLKIENLREKAKDVRFEELDGATRCYFHMERYEDALIYSERAVATAPNESSGWNLQGLIRTKLGQPIARRLESFLHSACCPSPLFEAYLNLAELYFTQNAHQIVKFLLFKMASHSRKTKLPSMYHTYDLRINSLKQWIEASASNSLPPTHIFETDERVLDLESRLFGASFSRLHEASLTTSSSTTDDDISDVRDPSRM